MILEAPRKDGGRWGVENMLLTENWEPDGPELLKQESENNGANAFNILRQNDCQQL